MNTPSGRNYAYVDELANNGIIPINEIVEIYVWVLSSSTLASHLRAVFWAAEPDVAQPEPGVLSVPGEYIRGRQLRLARSVLQVYLNPAKNDTPFGPLSKPFTLTMPRSSMNSMQC